MLSISDHKVGPFSDIYLGHKISHGRISDRGELESGFLTARRKTHV